MKFKVFTLTGVIISLMFSCVTKEEADKQTPSSQVNTTLFQKLIDSIYHEYPDTRGILIHIESPDFEISWSGTSGIADAATNKPLTPEDPMLIASMTKLYVSAAILRLVEDQKLELFQPLTGLLTFSTDSLLRTDGYDLEVINIAHLLSHTSGIFDFVDSKNFQEMTISDPDHHWTRREQIEMGMNDGDPISLPGQHFRYADLNYLLLTEIIEKKTNLPFYKAIRKLLKYEELDLNNTWFNLLEEHPKHLEPLIRQYATSLNVDSYTLHSSFDLYGGGGIASTVKDVALFSQSLFNYKVFNQPQTLELIYTEITTQDSIPSDYYMGLAKTKNDLFDTYGHGGFWGTTIKYIPELNTSICIFLLERDQWPVYNTIIDNIVRMLDNAKKTS